MDFKRFVKTFDVWEQATAHYTEQVLRSSLLLNPIGAALSTLFRAKADADRALGAVWAGVGLPTRTGEERTLHALNQLQSRVMDLQEQVEALGAAHASILCTAHASTLCTAQSPPPRVL